MTLLLMSRIYLKNPDTTKMDLYQTLKMLKELVNNIEYKV